MNNGDWKLSSVSSALVVSSGLLFLGDKKPKGLHLEDILEMIEEHPNKGYYCRVIPRRITLGEAIQNDGLEKLGEIRNTYSSVDLNLLEPDREFEKLPKTGRQLLENHYRSRPCLLK